MLAGSYIRHLARELYGLPWEDLTTLEKQRVQEERKNRSNRERVQRLGRVRVRTRCDHCGSSYFRSKTSVMSEQYKIGVQRHFCEGCRNSQLTQLFVRQETGFQRSRQRFWLWYRTRKEARGR